MSSELLKIKISSIENLSENKKYLRNILTELKGHLPIVKYSKIKFPSDEFFVTINMDEGDDVDDTNGIKYYKSLDDTEPFLVMGYSDSFFYPTCVLLKALSILSK